MWLVYRLARRDEAGLVADLNAEAYAEYPLFRVLRGRFRDEDGFRRFLRALQGVFVRAFMRKQLVYVGVEAGQVVCAALLASPDRPQVGMWDYLMGGGLALLAHVSLPALIEFLGLVGEAESVCDGIKARKWFVSSLAVAMSWQQRGLGGQMLEGCIMPHVKAHGGGGVALTTNTRANRAFYLKHGFAELDERELSWCGQRIRNWSFWRAG